MKNLDPQIDTTKTKEVALYIVKPSFTEPEYSIRIVSKRNEFFIEARIYNKNLWESMLKNNSGVGSMPESNFYLSPISNSFKNKLIMAFSEVIKKNQEILNSIKPKKLSKGYTEGPTVFDGTSYEYRINDNGTILNTTIKKELEGRDFDFLIVSTCKQMVSDLINNCFSESKYRTIE
jgi:hypothetical protein